MCCLASIRATGWWLMVTNSHALAYRWWTVVLFVVIQVILPIRRFSAFWGSGKPTAFIFMVNRAFTRRRLLSMGLYPEPFYLSLPCSASERIKPGLHNSKHFLDFNTYSPLDFFVDVT